MVNILRVGGGRYLHLKPAFDFVIALSLALPALVLVFLAAVAIKLTSVGPAFYSQTRVGRNGQRFKLLKLRTMRHRCEAGTGPRWSTPNDDRVTPVGRFLRSTHLDELPQLWNVLRGEMSLVGPRPERPEIIESAGLARLVTGYCQRLLVKPGLTGLAQIQLPPDTDVTSVRNKVAHDLWYIQNCSLWLDLRILLRTALKTIGLGSRPQQVAILTAPAPGMATATASEPAPLESPSNGPPASAAPSAPVGTDDTRHHTVLTEEWQAALANLLTPPPSAPDPGQSTDESAEVRAWFRKTAIPALNELAAELCQHERTVCVSSDDPEEAGLRVREVSGNREFDLKLRVCTTPHGLRVYARVLVRNGKRPLVRVHSLSKPILELERADVIAFVLARYREGTAC